MRVYRLKRPHKIHKRHLLLHAATAALTLGAACLVDVGAVHWIGHRPKKVLWNNGELQAGYRQDEAHFAPTREPSVLEVGAAEDGAMVWRRRKP